LYSVADEFLLTNLTKACQSILLSSISEESVLLLLQVGDQHNDAVLKERCIEFIIQNFDAFRQQLEEMDKDILYDVLSFACNKVALKH
jgi:hypothetical protein